jgi:hypothetical protein
LVNSQPTAETPASSDLPDVTNFSIEQSLEYQKTHNLSLEIFITSFANKIKFEISDFSKLCKMIYADDVTVKLLACVGLRRLLSIENNPPIQAVIDANLVPVFIQLLHH